MAWGFHLLWKITISPSAVAAISEGRVQGRFGLTSPLCGSFSFGNWCRDMVGISNGGVRVTREATQSEQLQALGETEQDLQDATGASKSNIPVDKKSSPVVSLSFPFPLIRD